MNRSKQRVIPKAYQGWRRIIYFQAYFFYPPILAILLSYSYQQIGIVKFLTTIITGLIAWGVIEYLLHRIVFHEEERGQWWELLPWAHHAHHRHPREISLIISPVWFSLPISILLFLTIWLIIGEKYTAFVAMAGIWIGYLWYEYVHYTAHCRQPKNWLMRYLKTYHLHHHHTNEPIWFGVTSPIIDLILGTYRRMPGRVIKKVTRSA